MPALIFLGKFLPNLSRTAVKTGDLLLDLPPALEGLFTEVFPDPQIENLRKDPLALSRILLGELISFSLQEKGSVSEGLVVKPQDLSDLEICFPQRAFRERFPTIRIAV